MPRRAHRIVTALLLATLLAPVQGQSPHSAPLRMPPTRSATAYRIGNVEYVPVTDLERRFGLKATWLKKDERLVLRNDRWKVELGDDSRDVDLNGMRILLGEPCRVEHHLMFISRVDAEKLLGPIFQPGYLQSGIPDLRVITIDPGHGGVDNGTQNTRLGLVEKKLTMDVAVRLGRILRGLGYRVVYTRETDTKVELPLRAAVANSVKADLFISIHFNSLPNDTKTNGVELFTFAPQNVRSTDAWSSKVSDAEVEASPVNRFDHWSTVAAFGMQRELLGNLRAFDRGKKIAHWGVLRSLDCPGMLVECGFLSNESEARKIATAEYRQQLAEAIAKGIRVYAGTLEALQPKPAPAQNGPTR